MGLKKGLTLIEITITMVITAVVLGGLLALMASMQGSQGSAGRQQYVSGVTQTLISRIIKDASEAEGNAVDKGIYLVNEMAVSTGSIPTFCIHKHQHLATPPDKWVCYWQDGNDIKVCDKDYTGTGGRNGVDGSCLGSYVASVPAGTFNGANPSFVKDAAQKKSIFTIRITNKADLTQPANPDTNPEYVGEAHVSPAGYSL